MTYRDEIIKNWIASGADPQLIRLNPGAVEREAQRELRAWMTILLPHSKHPAG
jgi:hypothetical protein